LNKTILNQIKSNQMTSWYFSTIRPGSN